MSFCWMSICWVSRHRLISKIISLYYWLFFQPFCRVQKIHFWSLKVKIFAVNWLQCHHKLWYLFNGSLYNQSELGNWDIDFFNFRHWKVRNFQISNLFKRNWNFAVIFWEYWKWNWKSPKYFPISQKASVITLKFCEMSLFLWNFVNYC